MGVKITKKRLVEIRKEVSSKPIGDLEGYKINVLNQRLDLQHQLLEIEKIQFKQHKAEEEVKYLGKCFKKVNLYADGEERFYLVKITSVDGYGSFGGIMVWWLSDDYLQIEVGSVYLHKDEKYTEISVDEFNKCYIEVKIQIEKIKDKGEL